jgi:hypothetical protein
VRAPQGTAGSVTWEMPKSRVRQTKSASRGLDTPVCLRLPSNMQRSGNGHPAWLLGRLLAASSEFKSRCQWFVAAKTSKLPRTLQHAAMHATKGHATKPQTMWRCSLDFRGQHVHTLQPVRPLQQQQPGHSRSLSAVAAVGHSKAGRLPP